MSAALAEGMLAVVKAATTPLFDEIKALRAEVEALKASPPVAGPPGPPGDRGETGARGETGLQGLTGETGDVGAQGPEGLQGSKGDVGEPGPQGERGEQGLVGLKGDVGDVGPAGERGEAGTDGTMGPVGLKGDVGSPGRDGVGLAGAVIDREGALTLTLADGATKALGVVVGAKGEPGRDGLSFGDLVTEQDERSITFKAVRGEQAKSLGSFTWDPLDYEGVYEAGKSYRRNQTVTWGGSLWVAREDTTAKPGEVGTAKSWTLAVKKGAQGDPGKIGPVGPQGVQGLKGDKGPDRW